MHGGTPFFGPCMLWPQSPILATAELLSNCGHPLYWVFKNLNILTAHMNCRPNMSLCKISSKSVKRLLRYSSSSCFEDDGHPPSWICGGHCGTMHEELLEVFIIVQDLVGIPAVVLTFCMFGLKCLFMLLLECF